jgi:hypothetical protein
MTPAFAPAMRAPVCVCVCECVIVCVCARVRKCKQNTHEHLRNCLERFAFFLFLLHGVLAFFPRRPWLRFCLLT